MQRTADAARRRDANQRRGQRRRTAHEATDLDELASRIGLGGQPAKRSWWPFGRTERDAVLNLTTPAPQPVRAQTSRTPQPRLPPPPASNRPITPAPNLPRPPRRESVEPPSWVQKPLPRQLADDRPGRPDIMPAALVQSFTPPPVAGGKTPARQPFIPAPLAPPPPARRRLRKPTASDLRRATGKTSQSQIKLVIFGLAALFYGGQWLLHQLT
jgi:hypothetical protein